MSSDSDPNDTRIDQAFRKMAADSSSQAPKPDPKEPSVLDMVLLAFADSVFHQAMADQKGMEYYDKKAAEAKSKILKHYIPRQEVE